MAMKPTINIKRIYDKPLKKDGYRVLVDHLWPRGIKKEEAHLDEWAKDLAPTTHLRKWFGHQPSLWSEFQKKYREELSENKAVSDFMQRNKEHELITLIYGAKDTEHNQAIILQQYLEQNVS